MLMRCSTSYSARIASVSIGNTSLSRPGRVCRLEPERDCSYGEHCGVVGGSFSRRVAIRQNCLRHSAALSSRDRPWFKMKVINRYLLEVWTRTTTSQLYNTLIPKSFLLPMLRSNLNRFWRYFEDSVGILEVCRIGQKVRYAFTDLCCGIVLNSVSRQYLMRGHSGNS